MKDLKFKHSKFPSSNFVIVVAHLLTLRVYFLFTYIMYACMSANVCTHLTHVHAHSRSSMGSKEALTFQICLSEA